MLWNFCYIYTHIIYIIIYIIWYKQLYIVFRWAHLFASNCDSGVQSWCHAECLRRYGGCERVCCRATLQQQAYVCPALDIWVARTCDTNKNFLHMLPMIVLSFNLRQGLDRTPTSLPEALSGTFSQDQRCQRCQRCLTAHANWRQVLRMPSSRLLQRMLRPNESRLPTDNCVEISDMLRATEIGPRVNVLTGRNFPHGSSCFKVHLSKLQPS